MPDEIDYETDAVEMAANDAYTAVTACIKAARDWWSGDEPSPAALEDAFDTAAVCFNKMGNRLRELDQVLCVEKRRRLRKEG